MAKAIFFLFLFLKASFSFDIRVLVKKDNTICVSSTGYYEVISHLGRITTRYKEPICFSIKDGLIEITDYGILEPPIIIEPINSYISVSKRTYRGNIEINIEDKKLIAINIVDIEEYLYGIIKMEIDTKWPYEAVKAQAIIARTFAYKNLGRHIKYDLCDDVHCQVYGGINAEDEIARNAVNETKNEVIYYKENVAFVYYHSACGGRTGNPQYTWEGGKSFPYLSSVLCPYCKGSPHYYWKAKISHSYIEEKLGIKPYSIKKYLKEGRVFKVIIKHSRGESEILASKFRRILGENLIKSTMFDIEENDGFYLFIGNGYGHGVGLCQWGAKELGRLGATYSNIISFYFPGCEIKKVIEE